MARAVLFLLSLLSLVPPCFGQGLIGDGIADNAPIWNQIVSNVCASSDRKINIGMGRFRFASAMAPITCSIQVQGQGPGVSNLVMDFSDPGGSAYYVIGGVDNYGGGSLRDVGIYVTSGHDIGFAVHIEAHREIDPTVISRNPHGWLAENVIIGRDGNGRPPWTGTFHYGIYLDGLANASPPDGVPPGIRFVRVLSSSVSAFTYLPVFAYYAKGSSFIGFQCPAAATSTAVYAIEGIHDDGSTYVAANGCPYVNGG